ncbi:hypothetical protein FB567DRAFT_561697 [Paraphoma chrysanthemicola]|uniref:RING-type domain-containing protein n=1 Tax=Paraphoma chrysanthemicola TaxID=798071 RepID=A0A8K0VX33_9PLEO|nr:hypothetical protein FB567DRAFT_561697 [Paraphoma chrysanthemicola]
MILYQDFVDGVLAIFPAGTVPDGPRCPICSGVYGQAGLGPSTALGFLNELPGAGPKPFIQHVVEPVTTACGHTYCTLCISAWLNTHVPANCPMCRRDIVLSQELRDWDDNSWLHDHDPAIEGLSISTRAESPRIEEIFGIVSMSTRELLKTKEEEMPFTWNVPDMLDDLPKIMVIIARRFHYQSRREVVPPDLSFMRLHNPVSRVSRRTTPGIDSLYHLSRFDAPLSKHPDTIELYERLRTEIKALEGNLKFYKGECWNWTIPSMWLYKPVRRTMKGANGGMKETRWWQYVQLVIKALLVWQCYCKRVDELMAGAYQGVAVDQARAQEGVTAYHVE